MSDSGQQKDPRLAAPAVRSAGTRRAVLAVAALVLAADQVSKSLVLAAQPHGTGGLLSVRLVRNTGASFGIGSGHPVLITLVAAAVLGVAVALLARARSRAVALWLAAVVGGAAGNLADRLLRSPGLGRGAVVDWIHVAGYPATFNLADVAIRLGALGALIAALSGSPGAARWRPGRRVRVRRFFPACRAAGGDGRSGTIEQGPLHLWDGGGLVGP